MSSKEERSLTRARLATLPALAALAAMLAWTVLHLEVRTDITHFVPESEDRELAEIATQLSRSDLNRTVTLTLRARGGEEETIAAARTLAERLAALREVEWVRRGPADGMTEAFHALYFARRFAFHVADPAHPVELEDAALRDRVRALKQRLLSPAGTFVRELAPRDPWLAFIGHVERLGDAEDGSLRIVDGQFLTADGHAVILVGSRGSPFEGERSRALIEGVDRALARLAREVPGLTVEQSGVHRFAVVSEARIRADIERISILSTVAVIVMFLVIFRSLRHLAVSMLPLAAGTVLGLFVTQVVFGEVHGLALAFGSALIGVGVDYVAHFLNHHTLEPDPRGPYGSLRAILPGLGLGAATTIAGLAGLGYASFPGVRELAVLTSVGIVGSLLATIFLVPAWTPNAPPTRLHAALASGLERGVERLRGSRARFAFPIAALVICAVGLPRLQWNDDLRALNGLDPVLLAEDERVRARVIRMDGARFAVVFGANIEEALARNDLVHARLTEAMAAGELERFRSLHPFLRSTAAQRASVEAIRASPQIVERTRAALEAEGFVADGFAPFADELALPLEPLTWEELAASPLGPLVATFRVDAEDRRVGLVTMVRGANLPALEARLRDVPGARVFDQSAFVAATYAELRLRTAEMVLAGLIGVFLIIFLRYRRLAPSLAAFAPAVVASATALGIVGLIGQEANLMHLLAVLLVLSMGEDYGVFIVEAHHAGTRIGSPMTSIVLACVSTVFSFGMLALSDNPALRGLGLVTGLGVLLSLVLAPIAWLFLPAAGDAKR